LSIPVTISIPLASVWSTSSTESAAGQNGSFRGVLVTGKINPDNDGEVTVSTSDVYKQLSDKVRVNNQGFFVLCPVILSGMAPEIQLDRDSNIDSAIFKFFTAGTQDWDLGLLGSGDSDFHLYSHDLGSNALTVKRSTGNAEFAGSIQTAAPSAGTAKQWRLGESDMVSPSNPDRTIRVEVDGEVLYLHAKTTND